MRDILNNPEIRARLFRKIDIELFPHPQLGTPCWRWTGAKDTCGYGCFKASRQVKTTSVHRATFINMRGPVPHGKELDHLCRNRWCCNPHHLQPTKHIDNIRRGEPHHPKRHRARQRKPDGQTALLPLGSNGK